MKLFVIFSIGISVLFLSPNLVLAQPDPLENPDRPYMTDGLGNGVNPGDKKKTSNEIFEDFLDIFFKPPKNNGSNSGTNNTNTPNSLSPILSPSIFITQPDSNGEIPSLPNGSNQKDFASTIVSLIHQDCISEGKGIVTKKNTTQSQTLRNQPNCLTRVQQVMNAAGVGEMHNSVNAFYYVQCVACARSMAAATGKTYNGSGNAKQHIGQNVSGYTYISNTGSNSRELIPGSIGISNEGTHGHIYYISEVYKDANGNVTHYLAFECNWGASGLVRQDVKRSVTQLIKGSNKFYLAGWQRPN